MSFPPQDISQFNGASVRRMDSNRITSSGRDHTPTNISLTANINLERQRISNTVSQRQQYTQYAENLSERSADFPNLGEMDHALPTPSDHGQVGRPPRPGNTQTRPLLQANSDIYSGHFQEDISPGDGRSHRSQIQRETNNPEAHNHPDNFGGPYGSQRGQNPDTFSAMSRYPVRLNQTGSHVNRLPDRDERGQSWGPSDEETEYSNESQYSPPSSDRQQRNNRSHRNAPQSSRVIPRQDGQMSSHSSQSSRPNHLSPVEPPEVPEHTRPTTSSYPQSPNRSQHHPLPPQHQSDPRFQQSPAEPHHDPRDVYPSHSQSRHPSQLPSRAPPLASTRTRSSESPSQLQHSSSKQPPPRPPLLVSTRTRSSESSSSTSSSYLSTQSQPTYPLPLSHPPPSQLQHSSSKHSPPRPSFSDNPGHYQDQGTNPNPTYAPPPYPPQGYQMQMQFQADRKITQASFTQSQPGTHQQMYSSQFPHPQTDAFQANTHFGSPPSHNEARPPYPPHRGTVFQHSSRRQRWSHRHPEEEEDEEEEDPRDYGYSNASR